MKKIVAAICGAALAIGAFTFTSCGEENSAHTHDWISGVCSVCGETLAPSKGLEYTLSEDKTHYIVSGIGVCEDADIVIPDVYENLPVEEIGDGAFYFRDEVTNEELSSYITSVTIFGGVKNIGAEAFRHNLSLKSINLGSGLKGIGDRAFFDCASLTEISVPENSESYKSVDGNLYSKDGSEFVLYALGKSETEFSVPDGVTAIGDCAFVSAPSLVSVALPDGLKSIGCDSFGCCFSLVSVNIPDGVTTIGEMALRACVSLTNVTIPEGVTEISYMAFYYCLALETVDFPSSITKIGDYAFTWCETLKSADIPDETTYIGYGALNACTSLESVTIGTGISYIGDHAFHGDPLTSLTFKSLKDWKVDGWIISAESLSDPSDAAKKMREYSKYEWKIVADVLEIGLL